MADLKKVIKGLECCIITPDFCRDDCPYIGKGDENDYCDEILFKDAIALLKAQEPVDVDEWPDEFLCPTCKTRLARRSHDDCVLLDTNDTPNFCWVCGQAVKWE